MLRAKLAQVHDGSQGAGSACGPRTPLLPGAGGQPDADVGQGSSAVQNGRCSTPQGLASSTAPLARCGGPKYAALGGDDNPAPACGPGLHAFERERDFGEDTIDYCGCDDNGADGGGGDQDGASGRALAGLSEAMLQVLQQCQRQPRGSLDDLAGLT